MRYQSNGSIVLIKSFLPLYLCRVGISDKLTRKDKSYRDFWFRLGCAQLSKQRDKIRFIHLGKILWVCGCSFILLPFPQVVLTVLPGGSYPQPLWLFRVLRALFETLHYVSAIDWATVYVQRSRASAVRTCWMSIALRSSVSLRGISSNFENASKITSVFAHLPLFSSERRGR